MDRRAPSSIWFALWALFASSLPHGASAGECVVNSAGALVDLLHTVTEKGGCVTEASAIRKKYEPYMAMAQQFHVLRFTQSMEIRLTAQLPQLKGTPDRPLLLIADSEAVQVRIVGGSAGPVTIAGGSSPVIIDGLTFTGFPGTAIDLRSNGNALLRTRVRDSGAGSGEDPFSKTAAVVISGDRNRLVGVEVTGNRGPGILITESALLGNCPALPPEETGGAHAQVLQGLVAENGGDGLLIDAHHAIISENAVYGNKGAGVRVRTESVASSCAQKGGQPVPEAAWHTALLERNRFWANGGGAIAITAHPLPPPVDLIVVSPITDGTLTLIGNIGRVDGTDHPWRDGRIDFAMLRIEIYLADRASPDQGRYYLQTAELVDAATRRFLAHIPAPIRTPDGVAVTDPIFTATLVDTENGNTSPFAASVDVAARQDWDGDGIANVQEDLNHDGSVDVDETDPRLADSDGDGLTDGEERLLIGHLAISASADKPLTDPRRLDPRNADSDGDCLPDGLEIGLGADALPIWQPTDGSVLVRPMLVLSPACEAALSRRGVLTLSNAIPADTTRPATVTNMVALYDSDPVTRTDPTNRDTDGDGLPDGAEDWNIDGARTAAHSDTAGIETPAT
ncbi:MAG: right-handed parallel beta-helix repeat-containing protein, partial [Deltaproteobacteria bacterium]|nr:right-handed parallel beta-helix repeat-containing protein [Deltaproteobacteria bacterium]